MSSIPTPSASYAPAIRAWMAEVKAAAAPPKDRADRDPYAIGTVLGLTVYHNGNGDLGLLMSTSSSESAGSAPQQHVTRTPGFIFYPPPCTYGSAGRQLANLPKPTSKAVAIIVPPQEHSHTSSATYISTSSTSSAESSADLPVSIPITSQRIREIWCGPTPPIERVTIDSAKIRAIWSVPVKGKQSNQGKDLILQSSGRAGGSVYSGASGKVAKAAQLKPWVSTTPGVVYA